ncbi:MAG: hypothetical protein DGJ47_000558, partial [Rickettsiaceae bacterium]
MNFNLDFLIIAVFLLSNLCIGLYHGRDVNTIKEYALGGRNFSTATLTATLVATWIGGSSLSIKVAETYNRGLYYISTGIFELISFLIVAYVLAPRMREFLGSLSIAEAMGNMYGKWVRLFTAIAGVIGTIGFIAVQFKVSANMFSYFTGMNTTYTVIASAVIVIIYSSYSGIRAVTFTDLLQLLAFCVFIPGLALLVWGAMDQPAAVMNTLSNDPNFQFTKVFDVSNPNFYSWIALLCFFLIPSLDPAAFQRISMTKDIKQVETMFSRSAFIYILIAISMYWIGILLLSTKQNLHSGELIAYTINQYSYPGLIGFTIVGIIAMVMSTADSYINSSAVLITHDICKSLNVDVVNKNEIKFARLFAIIVGCIAVIPAIFFKGLLDLIILTFSFYMPIVTPPFILSILGFRSSEKSVLAGMFAALLTVLFITISYKSVNSIVPGVFMNILVLFCTHYFAKQHGGWVGIENPQDLIDYKQLKRQKFQKVLQGFKEFNLMNCLQKNTPKNSMSYTFFGLFSMISIFSTMYSLPSEILSLYPTTYKIIYNSVLVIASIFIAYPLLPESIKTQKIVSLFLIVSIFYNLSYIACLQLMISDFGKFQLMTFLLNTVVVAILLRWQLAIPFILIGVVSAMVTFDTISGLETIHGEFGTLQFKVVYSLLFVSSVVLAFIKPKQEYVEETEEKVCTLENKVGSLKEQVSLLTIESKEKDKKIRYFNKAMQENERRIDSFREKIAQRNY